ncbi:MAG: sigma-70 family RNA polymerase sigma factor [Oscillibacter sp.]|nr:sigma-70 family RNA polymerase sigma factor [Oscillibacter sp.]
MTNEELAIKAKDGDADALLKLWEQNSGLTHIFARRKHDQLMANGNMCGVDMEDLTQAAFLALVRAVGYYDPEKEFSFCTYWGNCVKIEFNALLGIRTSKRDPLNMCKSLDTPLTDDTDADTLESIIPDSADDFANADERIYCSQIKDILKRELKSLSEDQQQAIQLIFYEGLKQTDAAAIMGVGRSVVSRLEQTAIFALRRQLRGLIQ